MANETKLPSLALSRPKALLACLPMMVLSGVMLAGGQPLHGVQDMIAFVVTFLFFNVLFYRMLITGRTDRWRAAAFVLFAVLLSFTFIVHMFEVRGAMSISEAKIIECSVPFCHIVITMVLLPMVLTNSIIFPGQVTGSYASIASILVIWLGACLVIGRGFCGWICFFGGWDDGFSRLARKARIKAVPLFWKWLPFAVLLLVAISSAALLSPTYCSWLCPFKAVTEFEAVTSVKILFQTIIFVALFVGLVIVLPILTKRRTQCGLFCPMGALTSFSNHINAFDVRIDSARCVKCGQCARVCPVFAITEQNIAAGGAGMTCVKCGKCIDACPKEAVNFHIKGTPAGWNCVTTRVLFLYIAFLFMTVFAGGTIIEAIQRLLKLVTTGHFY